VDSRCGKFAARRKTIREERKARDTQCLRGKRENTSLLSSPPPTALALRTMFGRVYAASEKRGAIPHQAESRLIAAVRQSYQPLFEMKRLIR